jgi:NAD(P)H-hydrate epimerase
MKVVTANEMRRIDQQTIEDIGIPGMVLMEHAGTAVVRAIQSHFPNCKRIGIFVGKGNNGGDGLVIARQLSHIGQSVQIFLVSPPDRFIGDALTNLQIVQNLKLPIEHIFSETALEAMEGKIAACDLIVDAIFGTGLRRAVRGDIAAVIERINAIQRPVIAIDLPSGLAADTGLAEGACIHADYTVTIGLPKRGLLLYPGAELTGQLEVADIGFPERVINAQNIRVNWTQPIAKTGASHTEVSEWIPPRPRHSHKGTYGRVFVVAGSTGMTGAAALGCEAALRVGAGLVTLGIPKSLNPILEVKLSEVMTLPLPETPEGSLAFAAKSQILDFVERTSSILAIGPGLSQHPETVKLIHSLIRENRNPVVIDADGLNALSQGEMTAESPRATVKALLSSLTAPAVLTPHPGEMARLIGSRPRELEQDRIGIAQQFAPELSNTSEQDITLVLKGAPTVIAGADGEVWLNSTGNPGMATAGMGDVLTGVIAGLIAQGVSSFNAAVLGVYLHGLAGDIVAQSLGMHGLMAGDVLNAIPKAIQACRDSGKLS